MNPAQKAAEAYAEACDNESGSFLQHQLEAIRSKAFLAGVHWHEQQAREIVNAIEAWQRITRQTDGDAESWTNRCLKAWDRIDQALAGYAKLGEGEE